jgi:Putative DNA-binding domain
MRTTEEQFRNWLERNHEQFGVEFKGPAPMQDKGVIGKVLGAAMRMANRRDGGVIVIGVDEDKVAHRYVPMGLSDADRASWRYDDVADQFAKYTEPTVMFNLEHFTYKSKNFVVLYIEEFDDVPVICRRDYSDKGVTILREGSIYCRSRGKPQVTEKVTYQDMRALLELAADKSVQRFARNVRAAGMSLPSSASLLQGEELFAAQNVDWTGALPDKIRSKGYWQVSIHPSTFSPTRIGDYASLYDMLQKAQVLMPGHGWPLPYMDTREKTQRKERYIAQEQEYLSTLEAWRFYQSGQFAYLHVIQTDWMEKEKGLPVPPEWTAVKPGTLLVSEVLRRFTMIYEFAARLALSDLYSTEYSIHVDVEIIGLAGRKIGYGFGNRLDVQERTKTEMDTFPRTPTRFSRDEVIARPRELALDATLEVCHRFGLTPVRGELGILQEDLYRPFGTR